MFFEIDSRTVRSSNRRPPSPPPDFFLTTHPPHVRLLCAIVCPQIFLSSEDQIVPIGPVSRYLQQKSIAGQTNYEVRQRGEIPHRLFPPLTHEPGRARILPTSVIFCLRYAAASIAASIATFLLQYCIAILLGVTNATASSAANLTLLLILSLCAIILVTCIWSGLSPSLSLSGPGTYVPRQSRRDVPALGCRAYYYH